MNPLNKISEVNDSVLGAVGLVAGRKEFVIKTFINSILLFIILLVFGCLDFATLTFHFEFLININYWVTTLSKTIAGVCAFNIGINLMWEIELKKDKILAAAITLYNHLIKGKGDDFEYFVTHIFNPQEKKKAYISQINRKIYRLNRFSRARDKLLYSSDLKERQDEKLTNKYCIKRKELEELKSEEYIEKNIDSLNVKYQMVDATVFELEIDGSTISTGVKTRGNVAMGKARLSSNVILGMIFISMFLTAITLELSKEEFANQMTRFWHYVLKCATDVGIVLWQTYRGMLSTRKLISNEYTQPYTGRNKVLKDYYKWQLDEGKISQDQYNSLVNLPEEYEMEVTTEELEKLQGK
jgi:hypothetical protein